MQIPWTNKCPQWAFWTPGTAEGSGGGAAKWKEQGRVHTATISQRGDNKTKQKCSEEKAKLSMGNTEGREVSVWESECVCVCVCVYRWDAGTLGPGWGLWVLLCGKRVITGGSGYRQAERFLFHFFHCFLPNERWPAEIRVDGNAPHWLLVPSHKSHRLMTFQMWSPSLKHLGSSLAVQRNLGSGVATDPWPGNFRMPWVCTLHPPKKITNEKKPTTQ